MNSRLPRNRTRSYLHNMWRHNAVPALVGAESYANSWNNWNILPTRNSKRSLLLAGKRSLNLNLLLKCKQWALVEQLASSTGKNDARFLPKFSFHNTFSLSSITIEILDLSIKMTGLPLHEGCLYKLMIMTKPWVFEKFTSRHNDPKFSKPWETEN